MVFPFLSQEWIAAAREIRARYEDQTPPITASVRANLNINEVPFDEGSLDAHLDTTSGRMEMDLGHLDPVDVTLTMDYATAKSFVVDQDQTAIMQAIMAGKVRIQGDLSKLMAMASVSQSAAVPEGTAPKVAILAGKVAADIKAITA
ncbi:MAG: SCP2 sterol-binding domain-containing protein [Acidimicrobiales bacterium]